MHKLAEKRNIAFCTFFPNKSNFFPFYFFLKQQLQIGTRPKKIQIMLWGKKFEQKSSQQSGRVDKKSGSAFYLLSLIHKAKWKDWRERRRK